MKTYKKLILIILIFLASLAIGTVISRASSSELYLNELEFNANLNADGSMDVTEFWNIKIQDTNTLFKTFTLDNSKFSDITNVKVKDLTSNKELNEIYTEMYHVTKDSYYGMVNSKGAFEIAWGVGLDDSTQTRNYQISYKVKDVVAKYNDYSQLYWQFIGSDFGINAKEVKGTITLPGNVGNKEDIKVWGHNENLNGEIYSESTNKINFELFGYVTGSYLEIRTLFPTNLITSSGRTYNENILDKVIAEETKWAEEANQRRATRDAQKLIGAIAVCVIAILVDIKLYKNWKENREKAKELKKYEPTQKLDYFREMPRENATPGESVYVLKEKIFDFETNEIGKIFAATLLNLNLKKVIDFEIEQDKKNSVKIKILKDITDEQIGKDEKAIFDFIKDAAGSPKTIVVKDLEKYIKAHAEKVIKLKSTLDKEVKESLIQNEDINKEAQEQYQKKASSMTIYNMIIGVLIFISIFLMDFLNVIVLLGTGSIILLALLNTLTVRKIKQRINVYTQKGIDESEKWKGLLKYMNDFSMLDKREVPEIVIWEKFLVYATAFGIADKVLKQLKIVYSNFEEMSDLSTVTYMNLMIHTNFATSFSNSISTTMTSTYSSASGGGGGFSGGGGGGRWPVAVVAGR